MGKNVKICWLNKDKNALKNGPNVVRIVNFRIPFEYKFVYKYAWLINMEYS